MRKSHSHESTRLRHRQIYQSYLRMVAADRDKIGAAEQRICRNYYYYRLSDQYGYDVDYIARIVRAQMREEANDGAGFRH